MKTTLARAVIALVVWAASACCGAAQPAWPERIDTAYLATHQIPSAGPLVAALRIADQAGEHVLVLNRTVRATAGRIDLLATYFDRTNGTWAPQWTIRDHLDCPGLDAAAEFFTEALTFTDLNRDGRVEVTVPYRLFCGGGIEPSTVKVILRDGAVKLAIRGESTIRLPGQEPFGGEHQHDKALLQPANAAFERHLDQVWQKVSIEKRQ